MTLLSATQLYSGWTALSRSDAPLVLGAELSVAQMGVFTLGAFFNMVLKWPEQPAWYPGLEWQVPGFGLLALASCVVLRGRGCEGRVVGFTGVLFVVAAA